MTRGPSAREVKQFVIRTFLDLGVPCADVFGMRETALLSEGKLWSYTYRVEAARAVWILDQGIVEFRDSEGRMLRTINLLGEMVPQRMAA